MVHILVEKTSRQVIWGGSREFRPWTLSAELLSGRRWARERAAAPEVSELAVRSAGWERGGGGVHSQHNSPQTAARRRREYRDCRARRCVVLWGEVRTAQHVVARPALIAIARPWLIGQATSRRQTGRPAGYSRATPHVLSRLSGCDVKSPSQLAPSHTRFQSIKLSNNTVQIQNTVRTLMWHIVHPTRYCHDCKL